MALTSATRIDARFAALKAEGRPALVTFVTAGDPDHDTSLAIIEAAWPFSTSRPWPPASTP